MKVTIAIDSFKGSLTSLEAGSAAADGILRVFPDSQISIYPVADGGEGTADALTNALGGSFEHIEVTGPNLKKTDAVYGITPDATAIMEISQAAGITLVKGDERNPMYTTTYGVGEMIADAMEKGCRNFIIGIGGSATNDGGAGMLSALGFDILDKDRNPIRLGAQGLKDVAFVSGANANKTLSQCKFNIACDVKNPLCGPNGCSAVYGTQKGADKSMIANMDMWLEKFCEVSKKEFPSADKDASGAGAAGGLGFAFMTFLGGTLTNGIELILREIGVEQSIAESDIVITGEGRLDLQTVMGKTPAGVAQIAGKYNVPVIAFSGCVTRDARIVNENGIDAFFPIVRTPCTLDEAMDSKNAYANMSDAAEQAARIIKIYRK